MKRVPGPVMAIGMVSSARLSIRDKPWPRASPAWRRRIRRHDAPGGRGRRSFSISDSGTKVAGIVSGALRTRCAGSVEAGRGFDAAIGAAATPLAVVGMQHMAEIGSPHLDLPLGITQRHAQPDRMTERQGGERLNRLLSRLLQPEQKRMGDQQALVEQMITGRAEAGERLFEIERLIAEDRRPQELRPLAIGQALAADGNGRDIADRKSRTPTSRSCADRKAARKAPGDCGPDRGPLRICRSWCRDSRRANTAPHARKCARRSHRLRSGALQRARAGARAARD